ncbi:MAG: Flp pilus assembly protein CpaB [Candidatus Omnitrophota bacterium]
MQKQRLIIVIVGVILGLIAVVMVNVYVNDISADAKRKAEKEVDKMRRNQAVVLVAKQDIPVDTVIQSGMIETSIVPREYVQPQVAASLDNVSGMTTIAPISRGEQISFTKLSTSSQIQQRDLASITPVGKRAVGVSAENLSDIIGLIRPGDNVDLIAVLSLPKEGSEGKKVMEQTIVPAFQNVLILAVGQETDPNFKPGKSQKGRTDQVTIALSPTEANILAFLQEQGKIRISLRSMDDSQIETVEPTTWQSVLEQIPALKGKQEDSIDIYRGLKKEKITISK